MNPHRVKNKEQLPDNFTGVAIEGSLNDFIVCWLKDGKYHKDDGPAVIDFSAEGEMWFRNGKFHREDGPAIIFPDKKKSPVWYLNGEACPEEGKAYCFEEVPC